MFEYIEREAVIANKREYNLGGSYDNTELAVPVDDIIAIPAADVRPVVRGKWIPVIRYMENTVAGWECSVCGFGIDISEDGFNFCPKCGADMRECET